jgi:hypothetical protein
VKSYMHSSSACFPGLQHPCLLPFSWTITSTLQPAPQFARGAMSEQLFKLPAHSIVVKNLLHSLD